MSDQPEAVTFTVDNPDGSQTIHATAVLHATVHPGDEEETP